MSHASTLAIWSGQIVFDLCIWAVTLLLWLRIRRWQAGEKDHHRCRLRDDHPGTCECCCGETNLDRILGEECPACGDTYHDLHGHLTLNYKGCATPP